MRGRGRKAPNTLTRTFESNGPDVKIRGTAMHIAEKYTQLARDAQAAGDRVMSENYSQHAEHYQRIIAAAQAQMSPAHSNNAGRHNSEMATPAAPQDNADAERQQVATSVDLTAEAAAETVVTSDASPVMGLDAPQPFIEDASNNSSQEIPAPTPSTLEDEDEDKPRRRARGTRGRGVRRANAAPVAALPDELAEASSQQAPTEEAEVKPRRPRTPRTPRARNPRTPRTATGRGRRPAADALQQTELPGVGGDDAPQASTPASIPADTDN